MRFQRLIDDLKEDEGYRQYPYKDSLGRWTIAFGNTYIGGFKVNETTSPVSYSSALEMLMGDVFGACIDAQGIFGNFDDLNNVRQEVLVNMAFNLGGAGLARFVKLNAAVLDEDWPRAGAEMKDSRWFNQVGSRAKRLVQRMITGENK